MTLGDRSDLSDVMPWFQLFPPGGAILKTHKTPRESSILSPIEMSPWVFQLPPLDTIRGGYLWQAAIQLGNILTSSIRKEQKHAAGNYFLLKELPP